MATGPSDHVRSVEAIVVMADNDLLQQVARFNGYPRYSHGGCAILNNPANIFSRGEINGKFQELGIFSFPIKGGENEAGKPAPAYG